MSDFKERLARHEAAYSVARAMPSGPYDETVARIRRARRARVAAIAAVSATVLTGAAIGSLALFGALSSEPAEQAIESPSPTESDASPTPRPSTSPAPEPEDAGPASLVDAATAESLSSPSSSEVWQQPAERDGAPDLIVSSRDPVTTVGPTVTIGERSGHPIVAVIGAEPQPYVVGYPILGVFELEDDGSARFIACPWASAPDSCASSDHIELSAAVSIDTSTHYDSLDYPAEVLSDADGVLRLPRVVDANPVWVFGSMWNEGLESSTALGTLGDSRLVTIPTTPIVPAVSAGSLFIATPFGSMIDFPRSPRVIAETARISFDNGEVLSEDDLAWPAPACATAGRVAVPADAVSTWVPVGESSSGREVVAPSAGDDLAREVYEALEGSNEFDPYEYSSPEDFVARGALMAVTGSGDEALLMIRSNAAPGVFDCI